MLQSKAEKIISRQATQTPTAGRARGIGCRLICPLQEGPKAAGHRSFTFIGMLLPRVDSLCPGKMSKLGAHGATLILSDASVTPEHTL